MERGIPGDRTHSGQPFLARDLHSPRYVRLRELLIAARKEAGLTQMELAKKLGRPQSWVADYERGERRIDVIEFLSLADSIGFDAEILVVNLGSVEEF